MIDKWTMDMSEKDVSFTYKGEEVVVRVRPMTWSKKNQILSNCLMLQKGGKAFFDQDKYNKECLIYMITQAPWGKTNAIFLSQIDPELGDTLQKLIPNSGDVGDMDEEAMDFLEDKLDESSVDK